MNYKEFRKTQICCPFCAENRQRILTENKTAFLTLARAPYHEDHLLAIPKRHILKLSELTKEEWKDLSEMVFAAQNLINKKYLNFSILYREGNNSGKSVSHAHFNIIPKTLVGPVRENSKGEYICLDKGNRPVLEEAEFSNKIDELKKELEKS
jgi:diadenosine tetraphosphate (Ap4A) HIT family hydrolase